ncbi:ubiquitin carboxyl-terminal hydrolase 25-like isoform X2 [Apostichopus japonicus]|uniref:ubiquitin carboxyl-terminal hydrolase 25-like isoform X2 n=1 Tax=Stichopus japonicus TaxID=307972 RepID=UPI003AB37FC8
MKPMTSLLVDEGKGQNYQAFTVRRVYRVARNQETIINQLKEITGIHDPQALQHAYEASNGDISQAVVFLTDGVVDRGKMRPAHPTQTTAATNAENTDKNSQTKAQGDVIDLTHDRDEDIQRAIAMSLQETQSHGGGIHAGVTAEEQDISRALEQSIKDPSTGLRSGGWFVDPINPYERQRENSWPVGLKNVGNTCWFSAVIQSLYHLPTFRHMVLSFIPPCYLKNAGEETENSKEHRNLLFMAELRALFALMLGTKRKYVDPTKPVEILKAAFSNGSVDNQQDVSEFTHKLLEWLEDAFKSDCSKTKIDPDGGETDVASNKRNPMLDLFYGQFKVEGINEGKRFVNTETFGQYPLRVQGFFNLHDSLEASTSHGEIETVNSDANGKSAQEQWFTRLPHVLTFELSRFQFNQALGRPEKIHNKFRFPQTIYMDRYMDSNRGRVKEKREELQRMTTQMNALQVRLDRYQCYGSGTKRFPLQDVLRYALDFATGQSPDNCSAPEDVEMVSPSRSPQAPAEAKQSTPESSPYPPGGAVSSPMDVMKSPSVPGSCLGPKHISDDELSVLQECLMRWRKEVELDVKGLQDSIDSIRLNIEHMFDEEDLRKFEFHLHAVLVHEGQASAGHYWAYILDHKRNVWLKFNDISVAEVSWPELERESVGGSGNASAYCVMYIDSSHQELLQDLSVNSDLNEPVLNHLADDLRQLILEDNKRFREELRQWDKEQNQSEVLAGGDVGVRTESRGTSVRDLPKNQRSLGKQPSVNTRTFSSASRFSTEHSTMSVSASRQAIKDSQDVFSKQGPEAALINACEQEIQRLEAVAVSLSDSYHDVRLQSSIVYFLKNRAPQFVIQRSVLEQFADKNLNYDVKSQAIRKMAEKRVASQKLTDLQRTQYRVWHDEYNQFTKCTAFFIFGVNELYTNENCQSALPYIVHACHLNDFFKPTDETKRQWPSLLSFCRRQTLLQLSEQCALQLESGESAEVEQGLEDMKELVVPCLAMLSNSTVSEDGIVVEDIRKKWCSFLGQDVSETVQDKLQDLLPRIIDTSEENARIRPPPLCLSEKENLAEKFTQAIELIKQNEPSAPIK